MNQELTIYSGERNLSAERNETTFAMIVAMIVGLLAVILAGGNISGESAGMLPVLAATTSPGILAWVLSYLAASNQINDEYEIKEALVNG